MNTIWKYIIKVQDHQTISMPKDSQIIDVQVQHGDLCLWAIVDPNAELSDTKIMIKGTGHPFDKSKIAKYIGTVQMYNDDLVLHIFKEFEYENA